MLGLLALWIVLACAPLSAQSSSPSRASDVPGASCLVADGRRYKDGEMWSEIDDHDAGARAPMPLNGQCILRVRTCMAGIVNVVLPYHTQRCTNFSSDSVTNPPDVCLVRAFSSCCPLLDCRRRYYRYIHAGRRSNMDQSLLRQLRSAITHPGRTVSRKSANYPVLYPVRQSLRSVRWATSLLQKRHQTGRKLQELNFYRKILAAMHQLEPQLRVQRRADHSMTRSLPADRSRMVMYRGAGDRRNEHLTNFFTDLAISDKNWTPEQLIADILAKTGGQRLSVGYNNHHLNNAHQKHYNKQLLAGSFRKIQSGSDDSQIFTENDAQTPTEILRTDLLAHVLSTLIMAANDGGGKEWDISYTGLLELLMSAAEATSTSSQSAAVDAGDIAYTADVLAQMPTANEKVQLSAVVKWLVLFNQMCRSIGDGEMCDDPQLGHQFLQELRSAGGLVIERLLQRMVEHIAINSGIIANAVTAIRDLAGGRVGDKCSTEGIVWTEVTPDEGALNEHRCGRRVRTCRNGEVINIDSDDHNEGDLKQKQDVCVRPEYGTYQPLCAVATFFTCCPVFSCSEKFKSLVLSQKASGNLLNELVNFIENISLEDIVRNADMTMPVVNPTISVHEIETMLKDHRLPTVVRDQLLSILKVFGKEPLPEGDATLKILLEMIMQTGSQETLNYGVNQDQLGKLMAWMSHLDRKLQDGTVHDKKKLDGIEEAIAAFMIKKINSSSSTEVLPSITILHHIIDSLGTGRSPDLATLVSDMIEYLEKLVLNTQNQQKERQHINISDKKNTIVTRANGEQPAMNWILSKMSQQEKHIHNDDYHDSSTMMENLQTNYSKGANSFLAQFIGNPPSPVNIKEFIAALTKLIGDDSVSSELSEEIRLQKPTKILGILLDMPNSKFIGSNRNRLNSVKTLMELLDMNPNKLSEKWKHKTLLYSSYNDNKGAITDDRNQMNENTQVKTSSVFGQEFNTNADKEAIKAALLLGTKELLTPLKDERLDIDTLMDHELEYIFRNLGRSSHNGKQSVSDVTDISRILFDVIPLSLISGNESSLTVVNSQYINQENKGKNGESKLEKYFPQPIEQTKNISILSKLLRFTNDYNMQKSNMKSRNNQNVSLEKQKIDDISLKADSLEYLKMMLNGVKLKNHPEGLQGDKQSVKLSTDDKGLTHMSNISDHELIRKEISKRKFENLLSQLLSEIVNSGSSSTGFVGQILTFLLNYLSSEMEVANLEGKNALVQELSKPLKNAPPENILGNDVFRSLTKLTNETSVNELTSSVDVTSKMYLPNALNALLNTYNFSSANTETMDTTQLLIRRMWQILANDSGHGDDNDSIEELAALIMSERKDLTTEKPIIGAHNVRLPGRSSPQNFKISSDDTDKFQSRKNETSYGEMSTLNSEILRALVSLIRSARWNMRKSEDRVGVVADQPWRDLNYTLYEILSTSEGASGMLGNKHHTTQPSLDSILRIIARLNTSAWLAGNLNQDITYDEVFAALFSKLLNYNHQHYNTTVQNSSVSTDNNTLSFEFIQLSDLADKARSSNNEVSITHSTSKTMDDLVDKLLTHSYNTNAKNDHTIETELDQETSDNTIEQLADIVLENLSSDSQDMSKKSNRFDEILLKKTSPLSGDFDALLRNFLGDNWKSEQLDPITSRGRKFIPVLNDRPPPDAIPSQVTLLPSLPVIAEPSIMSTYSSHLAGDVVNDVLPPMRKPTPVYDGLLENDLPFMHTGKFSAKLSTDSSPETNMNVGMIYDQERTEYESNHHSSTKSESQHYSIYDSPEDRDLTSLADTTWPTEINPTSESLHKLIRNIYNGGSGYKSNRGAIIDKLLDHMITPEVVDNMADASTISSVTVKAAKQNEDDQQATVAEPSTEFLWEKLSALLPQHSKDNEGFEATDSDAINGLVNGDTFSNFLDEFSDKVSASSETAHPTNETQNDSDESQLEEETMNCTETGENDTELSRAEPPQVNDQHSPVVLLNPSDINNMGMRLIETLFKRSSSVQSGDQDCNKTTTNNGGQTINIISDGHIVVMG